LIDWVLRHIDTVKVISRHSSFTGGGKPQVPLCALFQALTGTRFEPTVVRGKWFEVGDLNHSATDASNQEIITYYMYIYITKHKQSLFCKEHESEKHFENLIFKGK
jgi:hypothetical protein